MIAGPSSVRKVIYPLDEVLLLVPARRAGLAETFTDIARFGDKKLHAVAPVPAISRRHASRMTT